MRNTRDELIHLLAEAAETEHGLCCMYLFAAVSLKQDVTEGVTWDQLRHIQDWAETLYLLARQEMEHLGLVTNLLAAVGAAPHFGRPNFPQGPKYFPVAFSLDPFSEALLKRFMCFERPSGVVLPPDFDCPPCESSADDAEPGVEFRPVAVASIEQLYERVRALLVAIPLPEDQLFIGPPKAQIDGSLLHVNFPRIGALGGIFDTTLFAINDRTTALQAVDLIVEQGEGTPADHEFSHFIRLKRMLGQLRALKAEASDFEPARPLVSNPTLYPHADAPDSTPITNRAAQAALDLLNGAYETLLILFTRVYAPGGESPNEVTALLYTLFPMMTQVVRPLTEILVTLPADEPNRGRRAGPSYEISQLIDVQPDRQSTWRLLDERLHNLAEDARMVGERQDVGEAERKRLAFIAQNLRIMASKFALVAQGTYPQAMLTPGVFAHLSPRIP